MAAASRAMRSSAWALSSTGVRPSGSRRGHHAARPGPASSGIETTTWALVPLMPNADTAAIRRPSTARPRRQLGGQPQTLCIPVDLAAGLVDVQAGGHRAVLGGDEHLGQTERAGGGLGVADVGLDRTQQRARARGGGAVGLRPASAVRCGRRGGCRCRGPRSCRRPRVDTPAAAMRPGEQPRLGLPLGAVSPEVRPSWLTAVARISARIRRPSLQRAQTCAAAGTSRRPRPRPSRWPCAL